MTMPLAALTPIDVLLAAAVFGLIIAVWLAGVSMWSARRAARARRVENRLAPHEPGSDQGSRVLRLWREGQEVTTEVPGLPRKKGLQERLEYINREAELEVPIQTLILGAFGIAVIIFLVILLTMKAVVPGIVVGMLIGWALSIYVKGRILRRLTRFENQFVDALDLAARSLRAGHPLMGAFRLVSDEIPSPVGTIFNDVCQEQSLGMSLEHALQRASEKHPSPDLKLFVTSIVIQMRSGGNLADMMERIAFVIRDRMRLTRRVRVLTAQTQLSKRILLVLPFIVFFVLHLINPRYMSTFYETVDGQVLLAISAASMAVGAWIMARLLIIKY
jgi:tight adherence protein B